MNDTDRQTGHGGSAADPSPSREDKVPAATGAGARAPQGGVGGQSGTGQAHPHRGVEDRAEVTRRSADAIGVGEQADAATYQSGGTHQDRAQRDQELKQRDGGAGVAHSPQGGADPAPGAAAVRRRR